MAAQLSKKISNKKSAFELFRALAVSMVVLGHLSTSLNDFPLVLKNILISISGYGVPLFFIISGFLLSASFVSLLKKYQNDYAQVIKIFFIKRILRIYPAYLISLILLSIYYDVHFFDFIVHVFNIHNLFEGFNRSINDVYWTLAVEFQWYLCAPVIILFVIKTQLRTQITGFMLLIVISVLIRWNIFDDFFKKEIEFSTLVRLGQDQLFIHLFNFFIGIFLYRWRNREINMHPYRIVFLLITVVLLGYFKSDLVANVTHYQEASTYYKLFLHYFSIMILGFIVFLSLDIELQGVSYRLISFISLISYSLYIYHFPVLQFLGQYHLAWYWFSPVYLLLSIVLAVISFYLIEAQFLRYSSVLGQRQLKGES